MSPVSFLINIDSEEIVNINISGKYGAFYKIKAKLDIHKAKLLYKHKGMAFAIPLCFLFAKFLYRYFIIIINFYK